MKLSAEEIVALYEAPVPTRLLSDGRRLWLYTMIFTWRLVIGRSAHDGSYEDCWCFDTEHAAVHAFIHWDPLDPATPEPKGWIKHPASGRRRTAEGEEIDADAN